MKENLQPNSLLKDISFPSILTECPIWIALNRFKHLCLIARTTTELISMLTLLKKIIGKHLKVFHKFVDTTNEFIRLCSLSLYKLFTYVYVEV